MTVAPAIRSILVALDESERASLVFATAAMMARCLGAQLFPVRVLVIPPEIPAAAHSRPDGVPEQLLHDARTALQALLRTEPAVEYGPPLVLFGDPWREIVDKAAAFDVDLVGIGSRR